jgi:hypothetical protein
MAYCTRAQLLQVARRRHTMAAAGPDRQVLPRESEAP